MFRTNVRALHGFCFLFCDLQCEFGIGSEAIEWVHTGRGRKRIGTRALQVLMKFYF